MIRMSEQKDMSGDKTLSGGGFNINPVDIIMYKPQNKMFRFYKTFCSRITLINTNQNVILNPI